MWLTIPRPPRPPGFGHDDVTALTYAGLMSAGPFFVSREDVGLGLGSPSVVLDLDKMACYVAEKVYTPSILQQ